MTRDARDPDSREVAEPPAAGSGVPSAAEPADGAKDGCERSAGGPEPGPLSGAGPLDESALGAPGPAIAEYAWERVLDLIAEADEVALACHVSPDGDALGSMLAVARALRRLGKRVVASFGDREFTVPRLLRFLPGLELLSPPEEYPHAPELMITFDASTLARLGRLTEHAGRAKNLVVVDHHPSNQGFGTHALIDPAVAATAVLAEELIDRLGVRLDVETATDLYVGLTTDTGSFRYSSTTPGAHELAAKLVATGLDPEEIARTLWDRSPFAYLKVLSTALDRVVLEDDLVWTHVTREDRDGLPYDEVEGIIDVIRRTQEAEVAVVLKQDDAGDWQVSTRSKGAVDVGAICTALGGGGHARAAGYTSRAPVDETMARFRELLRKSR